MQRSKLILLTETRQETGAGTIRRLNRIRNHLASASLALSLLITNQIKIIMSKTQITNKRKKSKKKNRKKTILQMKKSKRTRSTPSIVTLLLATRTEAKI